MVEESEGMGKAAHGRQGGSTHSPLALVHTGPHAQTLDILCCIHCVICTTAVIAV